MSCSETIYKDKDVSTKLMLCTFVFAHDPSVVLDTRLCLNSHLAGLFLFHLKGWNAHLVSTSFEQSGPWAHTPEGPGCMRAASAWSHRNHGDWLRIETCSLYFKCLEARLTPRYSMAQVNLLPHPARWVCGKALAANIKKMTSYLELQASKTCTARRACRPHIFQGLQT